MSRDTGYWKRIKWDERITEGQGSKGCGYLANEGGELHVQQSARAVNVPLCAHRSRHESGVSTRKQGIDAGKRARDEGSDSTGSDAAMLHMSDVIG